MSQLEGHYLEWDADLDSYVCVGCEHCEEGKRFSLQGDVIRRLEREDTALVTKSEIENVLKENTTEDVDFDVNFADR